MDARRKYWITYLVLALLCSTGISEALAQKTKAGKAPAGHVLVPAAQRMTVQLTEAERDFVLNEMRAQLDMLYVMTEGLSRKDMATVTAAAKRRGSDKLAEAPASTFERAPAPYREMIVGSRAKIDQIAVEAAAKAEPELILRRITELLQICNSCHADWQLKVIAPAPAKR